MVDGDGGGGGGGGIAMTPSTHRGHLPKINPLLIGRSNIEKTAF